jgi:hypothetical protein
MLIHTLRTEKEANAKNTAAEEIVSTRVYLKRELGANFREGANQSKENMLYYYTRNGG